MAKFIIYCTVTATVRETWTIDASDEASARELFEDEPDGQIAEFVSQEVIGDEENREVEGVDPYEVSAAADQPNAARMAIEDALAFVAGFEGDEMQEGIDGPSGLLARLRGVLATMEA